VRHQLTWLRDQPVEWLAPGELDAFCAALAPLPAPPGD